MPRTRLRRFPAQLSICLFLLIASGVDVQRVSAQTSGDLYVTRPTTCPIHLRGGLPGWLFGYWHSGKTWTPDWNRSMVLEPVNYSIARYRPAKTDGYATGKGEYIEAWYFGRARWYNPEIDVICQATDHYFQGRLIGVDERYGTYNHRGTVEQCGGAAGAEADAETYYGDGYDPYDPGDGSVTPDSCSGSGGSGDGPDGSDGGDPKIFDGGGGGGGSESICPDAMPFYYDFACIEIWVEGVGWQTIWCGAVKFCG